ncbi:MAG: cofactor-independent phosphoglycerate mutase [Syntrophales bacterium]|jgi:2,3-bisphosphoglycerate-independent phosphoglycerate mutase|nr:cofactor-independent phosphoglycerate mutase [Syntrophales bacterium]MDX9921279.1 cofactor-independent phosphoglycerate mutase [Syntrophales bacterium]
MNYIILLGDGMADYPLEELGGRTVLEAARTPAMDRIAREGTIGRIDTIPTGLAPGSDVANLSILGYDPLHCRAGRGALEAMSMGLKLGPGEIAFRCNLVTISNDGTGRPVMEDFTAGHISSGEARLIIEDLETELGSPSRSFHPGVGYRHLMLWKNGPRNLGTTPPHDIVGREIKDYMPLGDGARELEELMARSRDILADHRVNKDRISRGEKPATSVWLWGQGGLPPMTPLSSRYAVTGAIISAVDLLKGIGVCAGLEPIRVEGATGYIDTNYRGKAEAVLAWLEKGNFVFAHVESPDEMGHEGNTAGKIAAIEDFDRQVVAGVLEGLEASGKDFRLMVLSDHATPVSVKTHTSDPVPFAVLSSVPGENLSRHGSFGETEALRSNILVSPGHSLIDHFLGDWRSFIASL